MEKIKSYTDLEVWKKARTLASIIYNLTLNFPKEETYGITNQIRRCVVSIASNIAEGTGRQGAKNTIQFLYISRGSLYELETQLYISADLKYITQDELNQVLKEITECKKLLNGFINYYKSLTPSTNNKLTSIN